MSHRIEYLEYPCKTTEKQILKDIGRFAYDPQESSGYHGNMTFHKEPVYKDRAEAIAAITRFDKGWYSDHCVRYRSGHRIIQLAKVEWHC